jgi:DNA-binding NarL/FixJ family response regulator
MTHVFLPELEQEPLTRREIDVLRLLARGGTHCAIARQLCISVHTVSSHIKNAYRKLDVHSAPAAVFRAVQLRFLEES